MGLPERLQSVMDKLGLNQASFARLGKASSSHVNQMMNGRIKTLGPQYAFALQRKTGYSAEWLMFGRGPIMAGHEDETIAPTDAGQLELLEAYTALGDADRKRVRRLASVLAEATRVEMD